ncbi:hypothetical protein [Micromonospora sp. NPDC005220]|uniref:hypothetical protein n=1 Tax=Micromonospora sp. NPDC005220 TaxID=3155589 RepID=UPI0033BB3064
MITKRRSVMGRMGGMVIDYTDYGKAVTIKTPPPAATTDFAEMLKGLQGLSTTS